MDANARKQRVYDDLVAAGWSDEEITSFSECREITPEMAAALIGAWDTVDRGHGLCRGEFWCHEEAAGGTDVWLTIDNTSGDCWTEDFRTEDAAKGFLLYGLCAEDAYSIDDGTCELGYLIRCALQDEAELDDFDPDDVADPGLAAYKRPFEHQWEQGKLNPSPAAEHGVPAVSYALQFPGPQVVLPEGTDLADWLEDPTNLEAVKEKARAAVDRATVHEIDCFDSFAEPVPANELDAPPPMPAAGEKTGASSPDKAAYVAQLPAKAQEAIYRKLASRFEDEGFEPAAAARFAQAGMDSKICDLEEVIPKREVEQICASAGKPATARGIDDVIGASKAQAGLSASSREAPGRDVERGAGR